MICKIQDVREFRPLSLPAPSGWKRAEVRDQGEAHEHDARGCSGGMKRPRRGSDGEAMKYGMQCIPIA